MFSDIWQKLKEMIQKMTRGKKIENVLNMSPMVSNKMADSIDLWVRMYKDEAPWLHEPTYDDPSKVVSLGLPALIASEKARMVTIEMQSEITVPTKTITKDNPNYKAPTRNEFGDIVVSTEPKQTVSEEQIGPTERAEYLNSQYRKVLQNIRRQLEYGIAEGSLIIKPYIVINNSPNDNTEIEEEGLQTTDVIPDIEIEFDYIHADAFYPLAFDGSGRVTEAAFLQTKIDGEVVYTRLEYHKLENHTVTVINRAFRSENLTTGNDYNIYGKSTLGKEIPLTNVSEWKDIAPETTIKNVDRLLFGYFKMPEANTVDTHSPLGVSGFSRAVNLIREADMQYSRMLWEFEGGELAIDIDRDALRWQETEEGGHSISNKLQQRLFRRVDLGDDNTYAPFAPKLRDDSLINGLNNILMHIEDICSLSRGTLSDVAAEARTATELKILKQRSYSANRDIQKALQQTLEDVVYIMNTYCTLYNIVQDSGEQGQYDVSFEWDDSILVDTEAELSKRMSLMNCGLAGRLETRMWYFGETERQAMEALQEIDEENRRQMELQMSMSMSDNNNMPKPDKNDTENKESKRQEVKKKAEEKGYTPI